MKHLTTAAAVILAFSGAPAFAQNTLSAPMIEGAGPIESGPSVTTTTRAQVTTPTAPEAGPAPIFVPSPTPTPLNTAPRAPQIPGDAASVRHIQQQLNQQGFRTPVDGIWSAQTRVSLQNFQRSRGLIVNGSLDQRTVAALGITASPNVPGPTTAAANPSGVGSTPNAFPNPSGVGGTPNSFPNPSGVGGTPNSIPNPTGVGGASNFGGQANLNAGASGAALNGGARSSAGR